MDATPMPPPTAREGRRRRSREDWLALVRWAAGLGAVTAEALAHRAGTSAAAARGRLQAAVADGLLVAARPLRGLPALYAVTPRGMRAAQIDLDPCRIRPGNARHLIACAAAAASMERCYPDHLVCGERTLRGEERGHGAPLASAVLGRGPDGEPLLHRPDIVLWPRQARSGPLPIAVEVELTVKAQRRLESICRGWARSRLVAGVLYLVAPEVERALARAIERTQAGAQIVAVPLASLPGPIANAIPSGA